MRADSLYYLFSFFLLNRRVNMVELNSIIEKIKNILIRNKWRLSIAESLTGGLCQSSLVSCPGISQVFSGGIVSYTNEIKQNVLHVDSKILATKTAVSEEVVIQMAQGVQTLFEADVALAFTGEAGPFIQTSTLGDVYIAIIIKNNIYTKLLQLTGTRNDIRRQSVQEGLLMLLDYLQKTK